MCGGGATEHGYTGSDGGSGLFGWRLGLTSNRQRSKGQCHQDKGPGKYRAVLGRNLCQCITSWGAGVNCFFDSRGISVQNFWLVFCYFCWIVWKLFKAKISDDSSCFNCETSGKYLVWQTLWHSRRRPVYSWIRYSPGVYICATLVQPAFLAHFQTTHMAMDIAGMWQCLIVTYPTYWLISANRCDPGRRLASAFPLYGWPIRRETLICQRYGAAFGNWIKGGRHAFTWPTSEGDQKRTISSGDLRWRSREIPTSSSPPLLVHDSQVKKKVEIDKAIDHIKTLKGNSSVLFFRSNGQESVQLDKELLGSARQRLSISWTGSNFNGCRSFGLLTILAPFSCGWLIPDFIGFLYILLASQRADAFPIDMLSFTNIYILSEGEKSSLSRPATLVAPFNGFWQRSSRDGPDRILLFNRRSSIL